IFDVREPPPPDLDKFDGTIPRTLGAALTAPERLQGSVTALQELLTDIHNIELHEPASSYPILRLADAIAETVATTEKVVSSHRKLFYSLYLEKDHMNHLFRTLVNGYTRAISRVPSHKISPWSFILSPPVYHNFRFLNQFAMIEYLPKPVYYGPQIKAELLYQTRIFVEGALASLERIQSQAEKLEEVDRILDAVAAGSTAVDNVRARLKGRQTTLWERLWVLLGFKVPKVRIVDEQTILAEQVRTHLYAINQSLPSTSITGAVHLLTGLDLVRDGLRNEHMFEISLSRTIAVPRPLQDTLRLAHFRWIRSSWARAHNITERIYDYDLGMIHENELPRVRKQVMELCKQPLYQFTVSGTSHTICTLWRWYKAFSGLKRGAVSEAHFSWTQVRNEAITRGNK
ncbi:MAG: hypothetical protein Q9174_007252, partial [Haloplaca sp. 1 TL-2023]